MSEARRTSPGVILFVGILASLLLGLFGTFAWLVWVWFRAPEEVRATVSAGKKFLVLAFLGGSLVASVVGLVMTIVALMHSFDAVGNSAPSDKAKNLAEGISAAMNWTMIGILPMPIAMIVSLVSGYALARRTCNRETTS
jgi:hypothetical protein